MLHHLQKKGVANRVYLLPKVHKTPIGVRPINASLNYFLAGVDKYVALTLADHFSNLLMASSVIRDTPHFLAELYAFTNIPMNAYVCVIDVIALYPSLDRGHAL